jgi:hypothetical protein
LLAGITAHNLGVLHVLAGKDDQAVPLFEEAIDRKKNVFGPDHPEVAVSKFVLLRSPYIGEYGHALNSILFLDFSR